MRCPKCHYLSFDPEPRCRNCGYDLEVADPDLALRGADAGATPLPDLTLREPAPAPTEKITLELACPEPPLGTSTDLRLSLVDEVGDDSATAIAVETAEAPAIEPLVVSPPAVIPAAEPRRSPFRAPHTTAELPLFVKGIAEQADLRDEIAPGSFGPPASASAPASKPASRPPLAVRRAAPAPVRARPHPPSRRLGPLDNDLLEDLKRVEREEAAEARAEAGQTVRLLDGADDRVEPLERFGAAACDVAMLGGIAAFVLWATLRLCEVGFSGLGAGALVPLVAFLVMMDVGYLFMFTAAGGQTVGKMLMGIRVVGDGTDAGDQVSVRQATWRASLTIVSLGLGWLPALSGRGIALHDRLAHTRVVRA